jgi:lipoprotein-anchoring transpeptidase ErfK/SrfK
MTGTRRRTVHSLVTGVAAAVLLAVTACGSGQPSWHSGDGQDGTRNGALSITSPPNRAADVPTSSEITFTGTAAAGAHVTLTDADGAAVDGAMRADGTSWVPRSQLKYATRYTVKVTGKSASRTSTFTTMAKPSNVVRVTTQVGDDLVYGVGMPIVVNFSTDVPQEQRAGVERRLFVASEPPQQGAWNWFNGHEVHFRPKEYWQAGTKLNFRLGTGGVPMGGRAYGANDINVRASIGDKVVVAVDNASKSMTVSKNEQVLRTIPVSLGKPAAPSSSGAMVIMVKNQWEWFDSSTYGVPADSPDGYRTKVYWTERLTWGGQYIHAAPWSVADQGKRNVSHGCTNISTENAQWLFSVTHLGDPVLVKGTERGLTWGDGWTDWNVSWEDYLKGSALHTAAPAVSPTG